MKNIILIGMPGCGKTTVGKLLAKALGFDFFDCDQYIEKTTLLSIPEIFKQQGEDFFRNLETDTLKTLSGKENAVISTGGGVVERTENIDILKNCGIVVFINRPFENILNDIDTSHRPLLKDGRKELINLYKRRFALYKAACSTEIENNKTIDDVVSKILDEVKKNG